jgi:Flp pilus assembly protein TadG
MEHRESALRRRARTRWRRVLADDAGMITTVIVLPATIALLWLLIQFTLWYHARQIAMTAAREGARTAAAYQAVPDPTAALARGAARARTVLTQINPGVLRGAAVSTDGSTNTLIKVTVSGGSEMLLPGLSVPVAATAQAPAEVFSQ